MSDFFDWLTNWFTVTVWERVEVLILWGLERLQIFVLESSVWAMELLQTYVTALLVDLDVTGVVQSAYSNLPNDLVAYLSLLNVPSALAVIFASFGVALGLRLLVRIVT